MSMAKSLLGEFSHEAGNTRRVLERVPEEHAAWAPHPRSRPLGELALHIAGLPVWVLRALQMPEFDFTGPAPAPQPWQSREALLAKFDKHVADARAVLETASDAMMMEPWSLKRNGEVVFTLPRVAVVRSMVLNHTIHHRGQLTVYLRLKDVPLPGIYGPSADES